MKKKILVTLAVLLILSIAGVVIINAFIMPLKPKSLLTKALEDALGQKVEIGSVRYMPPANLTLGSVTVYQDSAARSPLFSIENLKLGISLFPYMFKRKLVSEVGIENLAAKGININGSVSAELEPEPASPFKYAGTIKINGFSAKPGFSPSALEQLNGVVELSRNSANIKDGSFKLNNDAYKFAAGVEDLTEPILDFSLASDKIKSLGKLAFKDDYIKIEELNTQALNSSLNLIGDISNLKEPFLNLYGDSRINIGDLAAFLPDKKRGLQMAGIFDVALFFKGKLNRAEEAELGIKAKSPRVSVQDIALDDIDIDLRMKNGIVTTPKLSAVLYDGILNGFVHAEPLAENVPFSIEASLENTDLSVWAKETNFNKRILGLVSSKFLLKGFGSSIDSLNGSGWLTVRNGYIWEIPALGGLANVLTMPKLKSIIFNEASGKFNVGNRKFNISDLTFYSEAADLSIAGSIDFNTNLDLMATTNMTQNLIEGSSEGAQIANILIQQAGNIMGRVKITGTLANPEYRIGGTGKSNGSGGGDGRKPVENILKKELGNLLKDILE